MPLEGNITLKVVKNDDLFLWHLTYGHLNFNGLKLLKDKNMIVSLPCISKIRKVCEGCCIYGKMHKLPFPETTWRSRVLLELVHSDMCESTTPSINGRKYFLPFVDDYTRIMWAFFRSKNMRRLIHSSTSTLW